MMLAKGALYVLSCFIAYPGTMIALTCVVTLVGQAILYFYNARRIATLHFSAPVSKL
jgi:hypothetical protein